VHKNFAVKMEGREQIELRVLLISAPEIGEWWTSHFRRIIAGERGLGRLGRSKIRCGHDADEEK